MVSVGLSGDSFIAPSIRGQLGVGGDFLLRGWGLLSLLSLLSGDCSTAPSFSFSRGSGIFLFQYLTLGLFLLFFDAEALSLFLAGAGLIGDYFIASSNKVQSGVGGGFLLRSWGLLVLPEAD